MGHTKWELCHFWSTGSNTTNKLNGIHTAYSDQPIHDILNLVKLSDTTVSPAVIYGMQLTWQNLTQTQTSLRMPHVRIHAYHTSLCSRWWHFFTEDTRFMNLLQTALYQRILQERHKNEISITSQFYCIVAL